MDRPVGQCCRSIVAWTGATFHQYKKYATVRSLVSFAVQSPSQFAAFFLFIFSSSLFSNFLSQFDSAQPVA